MTESAVLKLINERVSLSDIARRYGVSRQWVSQYVMDHGLTKRIQRKCLRCGRDLKGNLRKMYCDEKCQSGPIIRNYYTRKCPACGKKFLAYHGNHRFCSRKCERDEFYKDNLELLNERSRQWRRDNKDKRNAYMKAYYRKHHPKPKRLCIVCGKEFEPYGPQKYCSDECRAKN